MGSTMQLSPGIGKSNAKVIARGRSTGSYELAGRNFAEVPEHVYNHDLELSESTTMQSSGSNWWERVDPIKLNISRNNISQIPDMLCTMMQTLTLLDISYNPLHQGLPEALGQLKELKLLMASHCELTKLPTVLKELPLTKLDVSHNQLTMLPECLCSDVAALAELTISHNQLLELPSTLVGMTTLATLNVSHNQLTVLHDGLFEATNLRTLDASNNAITILPDSIGNLRKLTVLNLRVNQLKQLPPSLAGASSLVEVHLGHNALRTLPEDLSALQRLRLLELNKNYLGAWPRGLCALKLNMLDLGSNELRDLPAELGLMTTLRSLRLEGNPIRAIRQNFILGPVSGLLESLRARLPDPEAHEAEMVVASYSRIAAAKRAQDAAAAAAAAAEDGPHHHTEGMGRTVSNADQRPVEVVVKSGNLSKVPADVAFLANCLVKLDLSSNKLTALEESMLTRASALKVLMLPDNKLAQWPLPGAEAAGCLPGLWHCNLARNPIASIPQDAFVSCVHLRVLDLSGVTAVAQPEALRGIGALQHLSELFLVRCALQEFPMELLQLPVLSMCNLSSNQIVQLPGELGRMKSLTLLDVSNNELKGLPPQLGKLQDTLRTLLVEGNPLRSIRRNVLTGGTPGLLEYLMSRMPVDAQ